jgi:hypothetical protein
MARKRYTLNPNSRCNCQNKSGFKDLTGIKSNMLTVVSIYGKTPHGNYMWNCLCECGRTTVKRSQDIISGRIKSCGCYKSYASSFKPGETSGRLKILGPPIKEKGQRQRQRYPVQCECGVLKEVKAHVFKRGLLYGCKCSDGGLTQFSARAAVDSSRPEHLKEVGFKKVISNLMSGARLRNFDVQVTEEQIYEVVTQNCFYCGEPPSSFPIHGYKNKEPKRGTVPYTGVDRIDSSIGYLPGNIRPCCAVCNTMKLDYIDSVFFNKIKQIYCTHLDTLKAMDRNP